MDFYFVSINPLSGYINQLIRSEALWQCSDCNDESVWILELITLKFLFQINKDDKNPQIPHPENTMHMKQVELHCLIRVVKQLRRYDIGNYRHDCPLRLHNEIHLLQIGRRILLIKYRPVNVFVFDIRSRTWNSYRLLLIMHIILVWLIRNHYIVSVTWSGQNHCHS
jgi:hypothetical protein